MAIPTLITDLSTTASSNPPAGSESTIEGDNHIRAAYAFIAQNYANKANLASPTFTGTVTAPAFSGPLTGNVTGNLTGHVTGNLTGNVTGNASGHGHHACVWSNGIELD